MSFTIGDFLKAPLPAGPLRQEAPGPGKCPRTGKIQHATRHAALRQLATLQDQDDELMNTYKCSGCGCWHVGHVI